MSSMQGPVLGASYQYYFLALIAETHLIKDSIS